MRIKAQNAMRITIQQFRGSLLFFFYLCLIFIGVSCTNSKPKPQIVKTVDLENGLRVEKEWKLSNIATKASYIFLETKSGSFIGALSKVEISSHFIATVDKMGEVVNLFSRSGRFIKTIGRKGKGPGEYVQISCIAFNTNEKVLSVCCLDSRKLIHFNITDSTFKEQRLDYPVTWMTYLSFNQVLLKCPVNMSFQLKNHYFSILNTQNNDHDFVLKVPQDVMQFINIEVPLYRYNDTISFRDVLSDTVFGISKDGNVTPRYKLGIGSRNIPKSSFSDYDLFMRSVKDYVYLNEMIETHNFIFIKGSDRSKIRKLVFSKATGACNYLPYFNEYGDCKITNDIDDGPDFWPHGLTSDGELFTWLYPFRIKEIFKNKISHSLQSQSHGSFAETLHMLNDEANPIIMIVK